MGDRDYMKEDIQLCNTYREDVMIMKWLKDNYINFGIADKMTYKITEFARCIEFKEENEIKREKILNLSKAIRQDMKKIFLAYKKIDDFNNKDKSNQKLFCVNENNGLELFYDEERDTIQILMEYFLFKYRTIIEYTINILDIVIQLDEEAYRKRYKNKRLEDKLRLKKYKIQEMKLDYLNGLISKDSRTGVLNTKWFNNIRVTRNEIVHNGASCVIFNDKNIMFQIYDLNVDEIVCTERYLSNGNAIYCDYFAVTNIAYLVYFIDTIFSILMSESNDMQNRICYKDYEIKYEEENNMIYEHLDRLKLINFDLISEGQKKLFKTIDKYINYIVKE